LPKPYSELASYVKAIRKIESEDTEPNNQVFVKEETKEAVNTKNVIVQRAKAGRNLINVKVK